MGNGNLDRPSPVADTGRERRVVITGLGPVTPLGIGKEEFWRAALLGRSATEALDELPGGFPVASLGSRVVSRVSNAALEEHAPIDHPDRRLVLAELAARLALLDSSLPTDLSHLRAAVVLGNAVGAPTIVEEEFCDVNLGRSRPFSEGLMAHLMFHTPSTFLADRYRVQGPELTVSTGCTAGLDAVGVAFDTIRDDRADVVLCGAAEAPLTPVVFAAFDRIGALSERNHDPEHASRPFDRDRDGFVLAEGAAVLVLEERNRALARGARIYAEVSGYTSVSNGYHMTNLPADGKALAQCLAASLDRSGTDPLQIDHVNAHGSSTPQNDLCETNAIKSIFGERSQELTVNSLKSMIGHALGASNAIEIAACALTLERQEIHPTANFEVPGEGCDLDYVARDSRQRSVEKIAKLSSGFSGIHTSMILGRHRLEG